MKRNTSALVAACAMVTLSTGSAMAQSEFEGSYIGAVAGYSWQNPKAGTRIASRGTQTVDDAAKGLTGSFFMGYGTGLSSLYLGLEAEVGWSKIDKNFNVGANSYGFKSGLSYGLSARAGFIAGDSTLIYGRAGWQRTRFDITGRLNNATTETGRVPTMSSRKLLDGWRFGGGLEQALGDSLMARVEYNYTRYQDYSVGYPANAGTTTIRPRDHAVRVGIVYQF